MTQDDKYTSREQRIINKLTVINEYGYQHRNADGVLSPKEIEFMQNQYGLVTESTTPEGRKFKVHDMCIRCQALHMLKYKNFTDDRGKKHKPWEVSCNYVPATLPPGSRTLLEELQDNEGVDPELAKLMIKATVDPAAWAELVFGFRNYNKTWKLRWYQKEQLRCSSDRIAIRQGRRTGKSFGVAMKLLWYIFNWKILEGYKDGQPEYRGPKIIVVTPFQTQLTVIFDALESLLQLNENLRSSVLTTRSGGLFTKHPAFIMKFNNGGSVEGFVSGTSVKSDGSAGGSLRGASGDLLYLDEMDMVHPEILHKVVQPILTTNENVKLIVTSTPIGRGAKGEFHTYCQKRPDMVEWYLPSSVLPHWDKVKEEVLATHTEEAFKAEYMAEFVEEGTGVFKAQHIAMARKSFTYDDTDLSNRSFWLDQVGIKQSQKKNLVKVLGIDWNKNAGTEYVLVIYDPSNHIWVVADALNIPASEYSSVLFKQTLVNLNYKWRPDYIYPDEGYGHHLIEDLRWEAHRLQSKSDKTPIEESICRLHDIIKPINFSGKVEFRDPVNHTKIEKTAKEFLVENAITVFEENRIWIPESDRILYRQLSDYTILRMGKNGKPVYGPLNSSVGDHRLDALMLALGGLFLEFHPLYSDEKLPPSLPGVVLADKKKREQLQPGFNQFVKAMDSLGVGVSLNKINITRPEMEEDEIWKKNQYSNKRKSRGDLFNNNDVDPNSALAHLWPEASKNRGYMVNNKSISAPMPTNPRVNTRGRGSRSNILRNKSRGRSF